MGFLSTLNNLNSLWLVIIIALGLCFITISVVLILLERVKRHASEDFSKQDKTMIIGLVEERIDELIAKLDILKEDFENSTQNVFNKITTKIDEVNILKDQNPQLKMESIVSVLSNLNENIGSVSKKIDVLKERIDKIESTVNYQLQQGQHNG